MRHYFILITLTILWSSIVLISSLSAQDDIACAQYAKIAVMQNEINIENNCGLSGSRWSSDYNHHFKWCMNVSGENAQSEILARALALKQAGADPKCKFYLRTKLKLKEIYVIDEADGGGRNAEPYLWSVFFKLDNETITQLNNPDGNWFYAPYGDHGNVGTNNGDGWDANDIIKIPSFIGEWQTDLQFIEMEPFTDINNNCIYDDGEAFQDLDGNRTWNKFPAEEEQKYQLSVMAVLILLEEDDFPSSESIRNIYHPRFKNTLIDRVQESIGKYPAFWGALHQGALKSIKDNIQVSMKDALSDPDALYIFPLVAGMVNIDDFIGAEIFRWSWHDFESNPIMPFEVTWNSSTGSEDGAYKILGEISGKLICDYMKPERIALKTHDGHYVCAENGGGREILANRTSIGPWETFEVIRLKGNKIALKTHNDQYICAEGGGGREIVANRPGIGPWESFELIRLQDNRLALKAYNGQFICAEGGGGGKIVANRNEIKEWEKFTMSWQEKE